ncbi:O-antigen translocase [Gelidibacter pelagius]|uniref:O-antigen translocase n=1 Tax=Gelidibacter pelagius TaxID=2819985 RepID=A0ABS3SPL1_9FLAO|nr:O-antigen translocase [Gelidibacter pelagius]MBO3097633.1 O-antigen translocase [Gelidibacter pelagius]
MGKFNNYINEHVLFKVANLNTVTIITKIIAGILTSKAIAVFIGVEGMALIGNLRNFLGAIQTFSILGFYNGLVKSIAEVKNDVFKLSQTLSTAYYLGFLSTLLIAFLSYYNAESINNFLFAAHYNYAYVIKIMALALPFYALNMFSFAIINGFSKYKILLIINIIGQVLGLSITLLLIYQYNIDGAMIAAVIAPSLIFFITFIGFLNQRSLVASVKISNVSIGVLKKFAPFATMALVTAIAIPVVSIVIRNYIIDEIGIKEAGHWEAMQRISDYYLMFINSLLTLYFLPRFSEIESKEEFRKEVFSFYKTAMPIFGIGLIVIYLLRSLLVPLMFSEAFKPTEDLFLWQLLGDFVKVLSIVIAYQFIAKKMFTHFIIIEIFLVVIMYLSSVYLIDIFGVKGAVMGHFVSYLMHYGIILLIFGSSLFGVISEKTDNE